MEVHSNFSTLQNLLKLAYSDDPEKQQKAAIELSKLVDGTPFPAVSYGPLTHALCKLMPSQNRTVASYAARAIKVLLLDDALRPQVASIVPKVVCSAVVQWEDEILCLRELLAALQTLCWDRGCVKHVLSHTNTATAPGVAPTAGGRGIMVALFDHAQSTDHEVAILALATLANIFVYSDTAVVLSVEQGVLDEITKGLSVIVDIARGHHLPQAQQQGAAPSSSSSSGPHQQQQFSSSQRFYATACIANASSHPVFCGTLKQLGAIDIMKVIEKQSFANLHIFGSRISDCAQTALYRLSGGTEGSAEFSKTKYSFKWGTKPVMELSLASLSAAAIATGQQLLGTGGHVVSGGGGLSVSDTNRKIVMGCFAVWLLLVFVLFMPFLGGSSSHRK